MGWDVVGVGNALMDALVIIDDDHLLRDLGLIRGTMHPVGHDAWEHAFSHFRNHEVALEAGGSCANAIATAARLGGRTLFCGQVADDELGRVYAQRMTESCGGHALRFGNTERTGKCLSIISRHDAERTMLTDLGAAVHLPELGGFVDPLRSTRIAHFTGYEFLGGRMRDVVLEAVSVASEAGALISLDAADPFVVVQIRDLLWELITGPANIVFLNADEARGLTQDEPEYAIRRIADQGVGTVVVKLGADGSLVCHQGEVIEVGIRRVLAVDTTGAGDAYAGGFLYGMAQGWDARRCGRLAAEVAGLTVAQVGAVVKDSALLHRIRDGIS